MKFPQEWIAELKSKVSLVEVVGENVDLKKSGANRFMGRCPFHGDRSPSFSVKDQFYYCFGCKESGDVISFSMKLNSLSFEEACEDLAQRIRLPLPKSSGPLTPAEQSEIRRRSELSTHAKVNLFAAHFYQRQLASEQGAHPFRQTARDFLKKRGISTDLAQRFLLGLTPPLQTGLAQHLVDSKAPLESARKMGLLRPSQRHEGDYDLFRDRLMFPLTDHRGRVCGFGARTLSDAQPKYLNSSESDLFQKSRFLYGLFQAKKSISELDAVFVVEGYFDVLGLVQAGFENAVATCGTSLTKDHLQQLLKLTQKIIVLFDQDKAGQNATLKAMELGLQNGVVLYGMKYPSVLDPDEYFVATGDEGKREFAQSAQAVFPWIDHEIETRLGRATQPEERAEAIKQIVSWLRGFNDPVGRAVRVQALVTVHQVPVVALGELARDLNGSFTADSAHSRPVAGQQNGGGNLDSGQHRGHLQSPNSGAKGSAKGRSGPAPQGSGVGRMDGRVVAISVRDRQLLPFLMKFHDFGSVFLEAKRRLPAKTTLVDFFEGAWVRPWVQRILDHPAGLSLLDQAPEHFLNDQVPVELREVILASLFDPVGADALPQLEQLLLGASQRIWARFSQGLKMEIAEAEQRQDIEKQADLMRQFLEIQRKLKDFQG